MTWSDPTTPNVTDYTSFLRDSVGIGTAVLPDNSMWIPTSLSVALSLVSCQLQLAGTSANAQTGAVEISLYTLAVYNCAADRLINFASDQPQQTYFQDLRASLGLTKPSVGTMASASDQGTSGSVVNPDFVRELTLMDLDMMKTPYGRTYLGLAQAYGPTLWGLS